MTDFGRESKVSRALEMIGPRFTRACYGYSMITVEQAVERVIGGEWSVPDFQRTFLWHPSQVCDLADSLWQGYPIGSFLLWFTDLQGHRSGGLVADGLQRLTSLCLLFGRVPAWLRSMGEDVCHDVSSRFEVYFDIEAERGPRFVTLGKRGSRFPRPSLLRLSELLGADWSRLCNDGWFNTVKAGLSDEGCCRRLNTDEIAKRLSRVAAIRNRRVLITELHHCSRGDVLEIFQRLNSRGMKFRRLLLKLSMEEIPNAIRGVRGYLLF